MPTIPIGGGFMLIDEEDLAILAGYRKPRLSTNGYVLVEKRGPGKQKIERLHRIIMAAPDGMEVDHINHIRHDNRRCNLRLCTVSENRRNSLMKRHNTSGYRGVSYWTNPSKRNKRWEAYIRLDGKKKRIGYYDTAIEAARAYDEAAMRYYGTFAVLNGV